MATTKKSLTPAVTVRLQIFSRLAFHQYRLLVRAEKDHDNRLLKLTHGLGMLAANIEVKSQSGIKDVLERIAAYSLGWAESMAESDYNVFHAIHTERERQETLFINGKLNWRVTNPAIFPSQKLRVLVEEIGEVAQAIDMLEGSKTKSYRNQELQAELVQVAAVAIAWLETPEK